MPCQSDDQCMGDAKCHLSNGKCDWGERNPAHTNVDGQSPVLWIILFVVLMFGALITVLVVKRNSEESMEAGEREKLRRDDQVNEDTPGTTI